MKILNIASFVSERIKVKPITNAELDKAQQEIKDHATELYDLPLKYENIFVPGNVLTIKNDNGTELDWIVVSKDSWFRKISDDKLLVRYHDYGNHFTFWYDFGPVFKPNFPKSVISSEAITKIRGTIPKIIFQNMKSIDDLKQIYDKYDLIYTK